MKNNSRKKFILVKSIKGWSMAPLIKPGDDLLVNCQNRNYHVGNIVIYYQKSKLVVHRIIKIKKNQFLLKGDNRLFADGWFEAKIILGLVEKIFSPKYEIDLTTRKNKISAYLFTFYSLSNQYFNFLLNLRKLYKIPFLKKIYKKMIQFT